MTATYINWTSRVAIAGRVADWQRRSHSWDEFMPGDYHQPFGQPQARTEAARWLWQM